MGEADFYYFTCLKLEFIYLSGRTFLTKGKSHQNGFWKHLECSPQEVRTRIPVLQSLQQRSRSHPQIRFEHVPSMLPSIRQRHRLQENGLKSQINKKNDAKKTQKAGCRGAACGMSEIQSGRLRRGGGNFIVTGNQHQDIRRQRNIDLFP